MGCALARRLKANLRANQEITAMFETRGPSLQMQPFCPYSESEGRIGEMAHLPSYHSELVDLLINTSQCFKACLASKFLEGHESFGLRDSIRRF